MEPTSLVSFVADNLQTVHSGANNKALFQLQIYRFKAQKTFLCVQRKGQLYCFLNSNNRIVVFDSMHKQYFIEPTDFVMYYCTYCFQTSSLHCVQIQTQKNGPIKHYLPTTGNPCTLRLPTPPPLGLRPHTPFPFQHHRSFLRVGSQSVQGCGGEWLLQMDCWISPDSV